MTPWPILDWPAWRATALHLQLLTQIVGKVRMALTPWLNHSWHVALYVTPRGLTTSPIARDGGSFEMTFDFVDAALVIRLDDGQSAAIGLRERSVADFYADVMAILDGLGVTVAIDDLPSEVADPVRFHLDHVVRPFDAAAARTFHTVLVRVDAVFKTFRTGFLGKASPVHFFWGSFDLAVTRFSGRRAPLHPGGPGLPLAVAQEAYSHEEASAGFWPGSDAYPHAAFYAYAYPAAEPYAAAHVEPAAARFDATLGEFVLPYADVAAAPDPVAMLLAFLQSTYAAAADTGGWDRAGLECDIGLPGVPRRVA